MWYVAVPPIKNGTAIVLGEDGSTVESDIPTETSIPAWVIRAITLAILLLIALLILWLANGGVGTLGGAVAAGLTALAIFAVDLCGSLLMALGPAIFVLIGIFMLLKSVMPRFEPTT